MTQSRQQLTFISVKYSGALHLHSLPLEGVLLTTANIQRSWSASGGKNTTL
ncbi:MAG: hypothetical protein KME42_03985 [Tildeniella nuda ZEHNDER 1965/U140]|nr:hypothetical protein [Tildeniella nuda ZEHNDER 1965/U140]